MAGLLAFSSLDGMPDQWLVTIDHLLTASILGII